MKTLLLTIACVVLACSKSAPSYEDKLASPSVHDREFGAARLMHRCCGAENWKDVRRDYDAAACARAESLMRTSDDAILTGLFGGDTWITQPICTKAIGPEALIEILERESPVSDKIREDVGISLVYYDVRDDIVDALIRALPAGPKELRTFAIGYLARLPDERLVDLVALLQHPSVHVRDTVESALYRAAQYPLVVEGSDHEPALIARAHAHFQRENRTGEQPSRWWDEEGTIRAIQWRRFACRDVEILRKLRELAARPKGRNRGQVLAEEALQTLAHRCGPLPP